MMAALRLNRDRHGERSSPSRLRPNWVEDPCGVVDRFSGRVDNDPMGRRPVGNHGRAFAQGDYLIFEIASSVFSLAERRGADPSMTIRSAIL